LPTKLISKRLVPRSIPSSIPWRKDCARDDSLISTTRRRRSSSLATCAYIIVVICTSRVLHTTNKHQQLEIRDNERDKPKAITTDNDAGTISNDGTDASTKTQFEWTTWEKRVGLLMTTFTC